MSPKKLEKLIYPQGADVEFLKRLQRHASAERERLFKADHERFLKEAKSKLESANAVAASLGLRRDQVEEAVAAKRRAFQKSLRDAKIPTFKVEKSHNPARYAPYDMPWSTISCGGITACSLRGPRPASGEIGANLASFNAGGGSSVASVGFWYYAQQDGTLYVTAQASVWGRGYVYSALFGYASAYAGLRVYIERYSTDFTTWSASNNIYNNWGVLEFDVRSFDWVLRSASITVPVRRNTWYAIWADAVQNAYAGGIADAVSNFDMYVGPVWYLVL